MSPKAFVTLLTRDSYLPGVLVLHRTLLDVGTRFPLVVMTTPMLSADARRILAQKNISIVNIEPLTPPGYQAEAHDIRFLDTWTKLRGFSLYDYERIVMLDADMLVKRNMDELFDIDLPPKWIAAAHACACNPMKYKHYPSDWIPENCAYTAVTSPTADSPVPTATSPRPYGLLNSGLVVLKPSEEHFEEIAEFLRYPDNYRSFKFPDQDLLATVYKGRWKPLNWYYNALKTLRIIHAPSWSDDEIRCLHYILAEKPWSSRHCDAKWTVMHNWWWDTMDTILEEMKTDNESSYVFVSRVLDSLDTSKGEKTS